MQKITYIFVLMVTPFSVIAQLNLAKTLPPDLPTIFGENLISTGLYERDFALSPDGNEIFYTLQSPQGVFQTIIYLKKGGNGNWSKPEVAPFAGRYSDLEPCFTSDGQRLFFVSNRPESGNRIKDFDIWYTDKVNGVWERPNRLENVINTDTDEFYPSVTKSGNLYFTASYKNGIGKEDIYLAKWENGKYLSPVPLDTTVNSKTYEFNAFVSPDEDFVIFTSYGRSDDKGRGDLYLSVKNDKGKWMPAVNLASINSERLDYCPFVSFDRKILFFTSERNSLKSTFPDHPAGYSELSQQYTATLNGGGNIYWLNFEKLLRSIQAVH